MAWQLRFYCFYNRLKEGNFILNIWCIGNPYKGMDMWATPFMKFNTYSITFCFSQWTIKYDFFEKYFNFILKNLARSIGILLNRLDRS